MDIEQQAYHLIVGGVFVSEMLFYLAVLLPLAYLWRTGKFRNAVLQMWMGLFAWSVCASMLIPHAITRIVVWKPVYSAFPEMIIITPVILLGWMSSLIICTVIWGIRKLLFSWRDSSRPSLHAL